MTCKYDTLKWEPFSVWKLFLKVVFVVKNKKLCWTSKKIKNHFCFKNIKYDLFENIF